MRAMPGQMTFWEYYLENFSYGAQCRREGYHNSYDDPDPDYDMVVDVIDHEGHRFRTTLYKNEFGNWVFDATKGKGYDICWWKEVRPL